MIGIRVDSVGGAAPGQPQAAWFGRDGGDIGRSADCTLSLPDPERHISRRHAAVQQRDGRYYLKLLSAGLPVQVEGRVLHVGEEVELLAGQRIALGSYQLEVLEEPDSVGLPTDPAAWHDEEPRRFDILLEELLPSTPLPGGSDDEVDLLIGETGSGMPAPAATPSPPTPEHPTRAHATRAHATPAHEPPAHATPPATPPGAAPPAAIARPAPTLAQPAAAAPTSTDAAEALLAGLGLTRLPASGLAPEQWRTIGALLRVMTEGTLELLTARMVAKRELGADATRLRTRENNPLKFSPDVDAALTHLLGPIEHGFLPPLEAAREAFDDLRAHQVALLAGMRAALDSVMARFDPAALEQRIAPAGALESLIPAQRKARLWVEYSRQFQQIVGEVEGDFDALLGRAFLKAYQAQLAELARRGDTSGRDA